MSVVASWHHVRRSSSLDSFASRRLHVQKWRTSATLLYYVDYERRSGSKRLSCDPRDRVKKGKRETEIDDECTVSHINVEQVQPSMWWKP